MPPPLSLSGFSFLHGFVRTPWRRLRARLERWQADFPLRNASLSEGLRAACGASAMLLLGEWLGNPLFSWAAIGAFLTCLADSAGSNRARLASMGGFALTSTLGGMFAATVAGWSVEAGLLAIMACAGVAGFSRIYGAAAGLVLMLAAGVSAIMADAPVVLWPFSYSHLLIYFSGCLWAMLLGLTVWRIHPFAPARKAVARVYGALAGLAALAADSRHGDDPAQLAHAAELAARTRRHARLDIANAQRALDAVAGERTESRRLYENLLVRLARAGELLDCITVLADLRLTHYQEPAAGHRTARVLAGMAQLLQGMQAEMAGGDSFAAADDARIMLRLRQLVARLPSGAGRVLQLMEAPLAAGVGVIDPAGLKQAARMADEDGHGLLHRLRMLWRKAALHANARSAEMHHAWRCAAAAGATYLVVHLLELPFGYWATMATMLVMQPTIADSWARSMERAVGSIVGGVLAVALCLVVHSPLALAVLVFPLTVLTMALRPVSYGLYATFLTPVFVLVADVAVDPAQQLANAALRAGNNVIGAAVAVLASYLFWPRRRRPVDLRTQLRRMVQLNLAYLADAISAGHGSAEVARMHMRRRDACVANVEAGLLLQRLMRERSLADGESGAGRTAVALSRRLAADASYLWTHPQQGAAGLAPWLQEMEAALAACDNAALHALSGRRPAPVQLAQADAVETLCLLVTVL